MTEFERLTKDRKNMKCGGWDNDRVICSDTRSCGAAIVFPTSTEVRGEN